MENNIIALRIKELRASLNLTQTEFAESLNTTQAALSGYERGDRTPSLDILITIAQKYNTSIDWICGTNNKKTLNNEFRTYYDVLKTLVDLCSTKYEYNDKSLITPSLIESSNNIHFVIKDDLVINTFFSNWKKMYSLLQEKVINNDIYTQWLDGQLSEYKNHEINGIPF